MYNNTYSDVYTLYNTYVYMSHIIFENTSIHKLHNAYIYIHTYFGVAQGVSLYWVDDWNAPNIFS